MFIATVSTRVFSDEGTPLQSRVCVMDDAGSIVEYCWRVFDDPKDWLIDHGWIIRPEFGGSILMVTPLCQPTDKALDHIDVANRLDERIDDLQRFANAGCGITATSSDMEPGGEFAPGGYLERVHDARLATYAQIEELEQMKRELLLEVGVLPALYYWYRNGDVGIEELLAPRQLAVK